MNGQNELSSIDTILDYLRLPIYYIYIQKMKGAIEKQLRFQTSLLSQASMFIRLRVRSLQPTLPSLPPTPVSMSAVDVTLFFCCNTAWLGLAIAHDLVQSDVVVFGYCLAILLAILLFGFNKRMGKKKERFLGVPGLPSLGGFNGSD